MPEAVDLVREGLALDVVLHYADQQGAASKRRITIRRVYVDGDIHFYAYCHLRKAPRTFLGRNMIDLADGETGEVIDLVEFVAGILNAPKQAVTDCLTMKRKTRPRTADFDVVFNAKGFAANWVFGVSFAFRTALDIGAMQYKSGKEWTRGAPPQIAFGAGDTFYDPPEAREMVWGKALTILRRSAQITKARPDIVRYDGGWEIDPGEVTFTLTTYKDGHRDATKTHTVAQDAFADFLRTGNLSDQVGKETPAISL